MRSDAEELGHHDADGLDPIRHLDAGELLDRQHVGQVIHHPAQIVDPVGVRDEAVPGLALGHLFRAPMMVADVGHRIDDLLAIELQHDSKRAVRGGMIRAEVQEHEVLFLVAALHSPFLGFELERGLLFVLAQSGEHVRVELGGARRVFLAARVTLPVTRQQNSLEVGVVLEADAEKIPGLALVPVCVGVEADDGFDRRELALQRHLNTHLSRIRRSAAIDRQQVVEHREIRRRKPFAVAAHALIDGLQIQQHRERPRQRALEESQHRIAILRRHPESRHVVLGRLTDKAVLAEARVKLAYDFGQRGGSSVGHTSDRIRRA